MRSKRRMPLIILTITGLLGLAGGYSHILAGNAGGIQTVRSPRAAAARTPARVSTHGTPSSALAPDFTANRLDGTPVTLSSYRGVKPVVLNFFATWCPNCRRAMPKTSALYDRYRDRVEIIGVNLQEDPSTVQQFASSRNMSFPLVMDPSGTIAATYGITYTNVHVLIDRDGRIVRTVVGDLSESALQQVL